MKAFERVSLVIVALLTAAMDTPCLGHGTPIKVDVVAGKLTVSDGLTDDRGFADWVFADPDDQDGVFTPVSGNRLLAGLPGFDLTSLVSEPPIFVEAMSRPNFANPTAPDRWLWYADPAGSVLDSPVALRLDLSSSQALSPNVGMTQSTAPTTASLKIAELSENFVEHHLVNYLLNDQNAPVGTYGFFARLVSPDLVASDPLLIALNHGLDAATFQAGAKKINAAARLPGDYDGDEDVDGTDFLAWQRTLGSTTELAADGSVNDVVDGADVTVWRNNFGRVTPPTAPVSLGVPEPHTAALLSMLGGTLVAARRRSNSRRRL